MSSVKKHIDPAPDIKGAAVSPRAEELIFRFKPIKDMSSIEMRNAVEVVQQNLKRALPEGKTLAWVMISGNLHTMGTEPLRGSGDVWKERLARYLIGNDGGALDTVAADEAAFILFAMDFPGLVEIVIHDDKGYNEFLIFFAELDYDQAAGLTEECLRFFAKNGMKRPSYMLLGKDEIDETLLFPAARFSPREV